MRRRGFLTPLFLAVYYLLFLVSINLGEISLRDLSIPLIFLLLLAMLIWGVFRLVVGDADKAVLLSVLALFIFVSYGHFWESIRGWQLFGMRSDRHRQWLPILFVLFGAVGWLVWKSRRSLRGIVRFINITLLILTALALVNLTLGYVNTTRIEWSENPDDLPALQDTPLGYLPDIYYIILDGYASAGVLIDVYNFDNSPFLDSLAALGFYTASASHSNYGHTRSSLASSLNMTYLDSVFARSRSQDARHAACYRMIQESRLVGILKQAGYRYILLRSGFVATDHSRLADLNVRCGNYNEFLKVFVHTTMLVVIEPRLPLMDFERATVRRQLEYLRAEAPLETGPKFVFAHLLVPHPPYIFDAQGNPIDPDLTLLGQNQWLPARSYLDHILFLNREMLAVVRGILDKSAHPPVIIIQGDHGPGILSTRPPTDPFIIERMSILNTYYLPAGADTLLYPSITPVNSFSVVLNLVGGCDFPLLEDRSYYSTWDAPYDLSDVTGLLASHSSPPVH